MLFTACWQRSPAPAATFAIEHVSPDLAAGAALLLNDAITVYFNEPVDAMSVTTDSFSVVDAAGHPVRGRLRIDGNWVTYEPEPPLQPELQDGSLRPDSEYRLAVAGYPRPDGVRSRRGSLLREGLQRRFRTAPRDTAALGLPAPLRPLFAELRPFVLRPSEVGTAPLPADDARLQLHFTLPVLPTSVGPAAFEVSLMPAARPGEISIVEPRAVRLLPRQPGDEFAGSTVELEFGSQLRVRDSDRVVSLQPDDLVGVRLVNGDSALRDYSGRMPPPQVQWCNVVAGRAVRVAEWPGPGSWRYLDADLAAPGFEVTDAMELRPLVRQEAGDGCLGLFRPHQDTTISVGQAFDRGDGLRVASADGSFAFSAIDVPAGITVRLDARAGTLRLLARGRVRIAGTIEILGATAPHALRNGQIADLSAVAAGAAVTIVAGSGIEVRGGIGAASSDRGSPLALVTSGALDLTGKLPLDCVFAVERGGVVAPAGTERGVTVRIRLTPGLPPGCEAMASGYSPFVQLPVDRAVGAVRMRPLDAGVRVAWQVLPPDPLQRDQPDLDPARAEAPRDLRDGEPLPASPGAFLRLHLQARVVGGVALPALSAVEIFDR